MPTLDHTVASTAGAQVGSAVSAELIAGAANVLNVAHAYNVPALFNVSAPDGVVITADESGGAAVWSWIVQMPSRELSTITIDVQGIADPLSAGVEFGDLRIEVYEFNAGGAAISAITLPVLGINGASFQAFGSVQVPTGYPVVEVRIYVDTEGADSRMSVTGLRGNVNRLVDPLDPSALTYGTKTDHSGSIFRPIGGLAVLSGSPLSAGLGFDILDNITAMVDRPRPLVVWSAEDTFNGEHSTIFGDQYSLPTVAIVRHAQAYESAVIYLRATNPTSSDRSVFVCATPGGAPFPHGGERPQATELTIPAGTNQATWITGTIEIPNTQRHPGSAHRHVQIGICSERDARERLGFDGEYSTNLQILGLCIWGPA